MICLGCSTTSTVLNLHYFKRDSYNCQLDVRPPFVRGRQKSGCGYPPSFARSQKVGTGILGIKKGPQGPFFISLSTIKEIGEDGNESK